MAFDTKWPAARLRGPDVSVENALDFIRRTDAALVGEGFTNNRVFEAQLRHLLDLPDHAAGVDFAEVYRRRDSFAKAFGHVSLEHLGSAWVCSAWIGGPNGPVSPSGKVCLAKNFGKWPGAEEVESDLTKIADAFPWLTFDLSVWGHLEEGDEGLPSDTWHVEAGKWEAVSPKMLSVSAPDVITSFIAGFSNPMREQTWSIDAIERMWGADIKAARSAIAKATSPSASIGGE